MSDSTTIPGTWFYVTVNPQTNAVVHAGHFPSSEREVLSAAIGNCIEVTEEQYKAVSSSGGWQIVSGVLTQVVTPQVPVPLSVTKTAASLKIDKDAESCRLKFITSGSGQAMAYQTKGDEAKRFLATFATEAAAASASISDWPMLSSEVGITAATMFDVATVVNNLATSWISVAASIEKLRLAGKAAVAAATTADQVTAATVITWPSGS